MNKLTNQFSSIEQVAGQYLNRQAVKKGDSAQLGSFEEIFLEKQQEVSGLKFSKHAAMRLENRNISLSEEQSARLEDGVRKADEKGIQESLVIVDSLAFIVNVPNKTVVTAMDQTESASNIFTNIDGAVVM